jgi:peptide/nickel transport system substrate-binding protein
LDYLTFGVLPAHLVGDLTLEELIDAPFNLTPIGSGPYRFERLIVEDDQIVGVSLQVFEEYYAQKPFIERVVLRYYPNASAALAAYQAGEVMGVSQVTLDVLPEMLREPRLNLHSGRLPQLTLIILNLDNPKTPFFQDATVRRALMLGLNRQWMVDRLLGGQAIMADGPIFPGTWAYYDGIEHLGYDPDLAIKLLKDAGYTLTAENDTVRAKEGVLLEFELVYPDDDEHSALAAAIQDDWARLGVSVILEAVPYADLVSNYLDGRLHQAALIDLNLSYLPDPDPYPFWHQAQITGGQNYSKWDDRQASEYLEQARVTLDIGERSKLYRNFQVRFAQELPALPLFYPIYTYAVSNEVQGVRMGPLFAPSDRFNTVASWFLVSKRSVGPTATPAIIIPTETSSPAAAP